MDDWLLEISTSCPLCRTNLAEDTGAGGEDEETEEVAGVPRLYASGSDLAVDSPHFRASFRSYWQRIRAKGRGRTASNRPTQETHADDETHEQEVGHEQEGGHEPKDEHAEEVA